MPDIKKYQVSHGKENKGVFFHLSSEEYEIYKNLPEEQKRALRLLIKTLIRNPNLLNDNLVKYAMLKSINTFTCPICLMPFSSYKGLIEHIRYTTHNLKCRYCGKTFTSQDALLDHICKKHNICVS
ncbi:unknown [Betafusellovirus yellowstonense]|uniref:C2H2-type domain-containing protein n=1 Tax=Betafusellovirus yellowstonense TaxID=693629 RepID=D1GFB1_9VIRU|nr:zinc-finger domain protein [Acidianus spindle-shaped virus 1]ACZ35812.1 unknown [Acidianus spindle-shaped virus 1]